MLGIHRLAALVGACALALQTNASPMLGARASDTAATFPDPTVDPFYKAPRNIATYSNGQVIRRRAVTTLVDGPDLAASYQLLYRTDKTDGAPDATVATVFVPKKPSASPRLFSFQFYEDSSSFDCSPSYALVKGSNSSNTATAVLGAPIFINYALSNGWYAVAADHEGTEAAFIGGYQEGRAVLDGIRATRNDQSLPTDTAVALYGYSGGAHATVWASTLASSHAPDVNIVGAAHGGTPIDTRNLFNFLNKGAFSGFAGLGLVGLSNAYSNLNNWLNRHMTAAGKAAVAQARSPGFCLASALAQFALRDFLTYIDVPDALDAPIPRAVLARETLLQSSRTATDPVPVVKFPRLLIHSLLDEIVPYADEAQYVRDQCVAGADIQFVTSPISEHISGEIFALPGALLFLKQAFEGTLPSVTCGLPVPNFLDINSQHAADVLGAPIVDSLRALKGKKTILGTTYNF